MYSTGACGEERNFVLAVSLKSGAILLMKNFDDVSPVLVRTGLLGVCMEWSNSRELLAVAGTSTTHTNLLQFYSDTGMLVYSVPLPPTQVCGHRMIDVYITCQDFI